MTDGLYPPATAEIYNRRKELTPHTHEAFEAFSRAVFAEGALPEKTKQLIAVAIAHVTQCPYCIQGTPSWPTARAPPTPRSWRRSGWPPRCARAAPTLTPRWRWTCSPKNIVERSAAG